jgi:hypothetical protein
MDPSIFVSVLALVISVATAWLTLLRRGDVRMTQPTVVYFGPDGGPPERGGGRPKVFLRSLLYSTGHRGQIVESMFVRLRRGESSQTFNIWVYGDRELTRGSGLYVGPEGVPTNHHFLLPEDGTVYEFLPGDYHISVYAGIVGSRNPRLLRELHLAVSEAYSSGLKQGDKGLYFDWGPDSMRYHPHLRPVPKDIFAEVFRKGAG